MSAAVVLDASALLAFLFDEPGAQPVEAEIPAAAVSTVNWSEVCGRLTERGAPIAAARDLLTDGGLELEPLSVSDAEAAASLRTTASAAGLSLGDRCCLALATRMELPVLTADAAWASLELPVDVRLIR